MSKRRIRIAPPEELARLIPIVEAKLAALPKIEAGRLSTFDARRKAADKALAELRAEVGARVNNKWDGCCLRIGGIDVTCTAGGAGAMRNWIGRAERAITASAGRAA
ncbi:hypothetical protein [Ancylobacter sp. IITR112]|uniref:hypothetical protein n=1 Tax=Ancylobacter sp. IITR112 TaxID=3138073 RepID=UPI00352ADB1F